MEWSGLAKIKFCFWPAGTAPETYGCFWDQAEATTVFASSPIRASEPLALTVKCSVCSCRCLVLAGAFWLLMNIE